MYDLIIVGCGDIGRRVADLARQRDLSVAGVVRSESTAALLQQQNIVPLLAHLDTPESLKDLPVKGAILLYLAPPPGGGVLEPRVRNLCAAIPAGSEPAKIIYLSTSGVYGGDSGGVVTEETPPDPQTTRGKRRLDGERAFTEWGKACAVPVVILRVTGIYGPGRLPMTQLTAGHPVLNETEASFTNRIHADDLARICLAAADRGEDGDIFNVSDGRPGTLTEYFNAAADLLGLPRPPQVTMAEAEQVMTPLMLSYIRESRRLDNSRLKEKLGIDLLYPDLASGLKACLP